MSRHDVILAGGGHNGLVAAAYLAKAGRRVLVLERREHVGGVLDVVLTQGRLRPSVIADLGLRDHGLELERPAVRMLALQDEADPIVFYGDAHRTAQGLATLSAKDAEAYPRYDRHVRALSGFIGRLNATTPPRLDRAAAGDLMGGLKLGKAFRDLGAHTARELTRALPMASADFVREWFEHDGICAALAARGSLFTALGPWSAGSALVLLNDMAEGDGGAAGEAATARATTVPGTSVAGGEAVAHALRAAAEAAGAEVRTGCEIVRLLVDATGAVGGVALASGEEIQAETVACAVDPKTVMTRWLDPVTAGPQLLWRAGNIRTPGHTARVDLTLKKQPKFRGVGDERLLAGRIVIARGIDELELAFDASKYGELSERPYVEAVLRGDTLSALVQWVPHGEGLGDQVLARTLEELERHAPGIGKQVKASAVRTPFDLEQELGLAGGHVMHGELGLDQFFAWRPVLGLARYRLAVRGLYLCGSGAHPGGGVTGGPGQNAAREILKDLS